MRVHNSCQAQDSGAADDAPTSLAAANGANATGQAATTARADVTVAQLLERHDRQRLEIIALRRRNAALAGLVARQHAELGGLHRSTSWRLSAPVRGIKKALSRVRAEIRCWEATMRGKPIGGNEIQLEPDPGALAAWQKLLKQSS